MGRYKITTKFTVTNRSIGYLSKGWHGNIKFLRWEVGPLDRQVLLYTPNVEKLIINQKDCIDSLEGIEVLTKLKVLHCSDQPRLTSIEPVISCPDLIDLDCSKCSLADINGLLNCPKLKSLNIEHNEIESLSELEQMLELENLNANNNKLTELPIFRSNKLHRLFRE